MKKVNKISFLLTLKTPIVSVNAMYGTRVAYAGGKSYATMYRSPVSKKMEQEVRDQLRAVKLGPEELDFLKKTEYFDLTFAFVLRRGKKRDCSNMTKLAEDVLVRYFHDDLGIDTYDDSKHARVILSKSYLPGSDHEYILVEIRESQHNLRYDLTPKPKRVWFYSERVEPDPIPKRKKKDVNYVEEVASEALGDCSVYLFSPTYEFTPRTVKDITRSIDKVSYSGSGFVYLGFLGSDDDWKECEYRPILSDLAEEVVSLGEHGKCGFLKTPEEIKSWWS